MIMPDGCPHCRSSFLIWDRRDKEPYCFNCGWRKAVRISPEEAKYRTTNRSLWLSIVSGEEHADRLSNFV
jgi:hypothetical protein